MKTFWKAKILEMAEKDYLVLQWADDTILQTEVGYDQYLLS